MAQSYDLTENSATRARPPFFLTTTPLRCPLKAEFPPLASALRTFPQTTEQLLHVDKFLEREPAFPVALRAHAGDAQLGRSETFGELDVRDLL